MTTEFTQEAAGSSSRAAERMRLYRKRCREGIRLVRIPLRVTDIDSLIQVGRLGEDQRHDAEAIGAAVLGLFEMAREVDPDTLRFRPS